MLGFRFKIEAWHYTVAETAARLRGTVTKHVPVFDVFEGIDHVYFSAFLETARYAGRMTPSQFMAELLEPALLYVPVVRTAMAGITEPYGPPSPMP